MEKKKLNFVKDGVLRLPPGFRFHPTDEELIGQYLRLKVMSHPLPASIIPEVDVCRNDPWDLPGEAEQERYFFSTREIKYPNGNRSNRATTSGYWKATGVDKKIVTCRGNLAIGVKKTLVFYRGKAPNGSKTDWIMHEYRLANSESLASGNVPQAKNSIQASWVLCRIFLKKRKTKDEEVTELPNKPTVYYNFMAKERADLNLAPPEASSSSTSSGSSGITQVYCQESDDCEESSTSRSSCYHSFTISRERKQPKALN